MAHASVAINETNFPDQKFREYVKVFDLDEDLTLSDAELAAALELKPTNKGITNFKGIEHFTSMILFWASGNGCTSFDLSHNTEISSLDLSNNGITSLDLSALYTLRFFLCTNNKLTSLDVSNNKRLQKINLASNNITSINLKGLTMLWYVDFDNNPIATFDFSENTALQEVRVRNTKIAYLGLGNRTQLKLVYCSNNPRLKQIYLLGCTNLEELNFTNCIVSNLNLTGCTNIQTLYSDNNKLASLNVSPITALRRLGIEGNPLESIDVSQNANLTFISFGNGNLFDTVDLSNNAMLDTVWCFEANIPHMDLSANPRMRGWASMNCNTEDITFAPGVVLDQFYSLGNKMIQFDPSLIGENCDLGDNENSRTLAATDTVIDGTAKYMVKMPADFVNRITAIKTEGVTFVEGTDGKGGYFLYDKTNKLESFKYDYYPIKVTINVEYKNNWLKGDVNGDGLVDVEDINCLIDVILNYTTGEEFEGRDDVNEDGDVDVEDINAVLNIMMNA